MVVILTCLLSGCARAKEMEAPAGYPVQLKLLESVQVDDSSTYVARMDSRNTVSLYPKVDGHVTRISAQPEQWVPAGAHLLQINPVQQLASVDAKVHTFEASDAEYGSQLKNLKALEAQRQAAYANVQFAEKEFHRYKRLSDKGAVSVERADEKERALLVKTADAASLEAQIAAQKQAVNSARQKKNQSRADVKVEREQLSYHIIRAPFAGTVGNIPVKVGDYVTPQTKLTTVSVNKPLEVYVQIPKDEAARLKHGMNVELLDSREKVIGESRVFYISPTIDTDSQSVLVKSLYDNNESELKPDQNVTARVVWDHKEGIVIPTNAISVVGGQPFVFVAEKRDGGKLIAKQKPVDLGGLQGGNGILVANGLKAGEKLVVSGIQNLSDGQTIFVKS